MESVPVSRKRIRNRKRKRHLKRKRLERDRVKVEVRFAKREKLVAGSGVYVFKNKLVRKSMGAEAFWQNYTAAQRWQQRHNVVWWRTRCEALEYQNQILRDTLRSLAYSRQCQCQRSGQFQNKNQNEVRYDQFYNQAQSNPQNVEVEEESISDDESLEFQLNDEMMDFLKQSMQHKLELKQKREEEKAAEQVEEDDEDVFSDGGAAQMQERTENAKLLYGEASSKILGMEAALQTTIDRHKDKARPQYWPVIPLKL